MKDQVKVTHVNILFFVFALTFIMFQIILAVVSAGLVSIYGQSHAKNFFEDNMYTISLISEYGIILFPVLIYAFSNKLEIRKVFRLNKLKPAHALLIIPISLCSYLCFVAFNSITMFVLQFFMNIPENIIPVPTNIPELITGIFVIALTPAICEEALHRGILLKAYEKRGSMKAVIISAVFFGVFHFDITNFLGPIFMGLVIGYVVIRTNSIYAGVLLHFLNNTIAELLNYFTRNISQPAESSAIITLEDLITIIIIGASSAVILSMILKLFRNITRDTADIKPSISSLRQDIISIISHWPAIIVFLLYTLIAAIYILTYVK